MCLIHFLFRTVSDKEIFIAITSQIFFRINHKEVSRQSVQLVQKITCKDHDSRKQFV